MTSWARVLLLTSNSEDDFSDESEEEEPYGEDDDDLINCVVCHVRWLGADSWHLMCAYCSRDRRVHSYTLLSD